MNNMRKKILMTLALLLTAVTGAWADEMLLLTIESKDYMSFKSGSKTFDDMVTVTFSNSVDNNGNEWGWYSTGASLLTVAGTNGYTITSCKFYTYNGPAKTGYTVEGESPSVYIYNGNVYTDDSKSVSIGTYGVTKIEVYTSDPDAVEVKWDAATKTGTFVMPAFNVEIDPIYAPTAEFATGGKPTPIEGIIAGEAKDIVKAGIVAKAGSTENAQGTLMYLVTTTKEQPTSTTGFSATVPTGAALTGSYTEDQTVYVWYYIKGIDAAEGVTPTAENTFNDSEICATPLPVKLKANLFTLTLNPAPVKNITVTAGTETKTPTTEGKTDIKMNSEVKLKANEGYKIKKVVIKKDPVAEGHALTSAKLGEIVCSDGKAYAAADKDILPKGVKAEALVCYVDGEHGLALAMADVKNEKMSWDNERGANDGKTAAEWCDGWNTSHPITGATWLLASQNQWNNMISAAGSASNLSNAFSAVGGTNLQAWSYWSSTPNHGGSAAYMYYFPSSSWQWTYLTQDYTGNYIRACLEW